eukprot:1556609-Amphidinium_carterae.1
MGHWMFPSSPSLWLTSMTSSCRPCSAMLCHYALLRGSPLTGKLAHISSIVPTLRPWVQPIYAAMGTVGAHQAPS